VHAQRKSRSNVRRSLDCALMDYRNAA
jgi:hypothetical protein